MKVLNTGFKETAMKEPRRDVSRNAELSSLEDDNPNAAGLGFLFLNPTMKLKLCRIEEERSYGAGFRPPLAVLSWLQFVAIWGPGARPQGKPERPEATYREKSSSKTVDYGRHLERIGAFWSKMD